MLEVLAKLYPLISAERSYLKQAKIEAISFPRYYWQAFGRQDSFRVVTFNGIDTLANVLPAVDILEGYESQRQEVLDAKTELTFHKAAAYLDPGHFNGDQLTYRSFVDSAFAMIRERGCRQLIIDLRNNAGGDAFSNYLVSYLADRPFNWNARFVLRTSELLQQHIRRGDITTNYARAILEHTAGETFPLSFRVYPPQPESRRFTGKVYALINRQTHSQAAVTAAQLQDYGWATLVGEETAEYPTLQASQFQYTLPQTGITVNAAKGYIVRVSGNEAQRGVMPDMLVQDPLPYEGDMLPEELLQLLATGE